jgi:CMP-N-acetylneuraminate monooxygenase
MPVTPRRLVASLRSCSVERNETVAKDGVIVHRDAAGNVRAAKNRCRHMGGSFPQGRGCKLTCPRHGWTLDASTMRYDNPRGELVQPELEVEASDDLLQVFERGTARPWTERLPREALSRGELTVRFLAHACVEIAAGKTRIVTDPWLTGPAFARGWWLAHDPPADWLERLVRADVVYISHDHSDHLNEHTLRRLAAVRPDAPIFVPGFASGRCERLTRALGLTNVTTLPVGQWRRLGDATRMMILGDGAGREDSALLVEHKGHTVLDTVDCMNPNDGDIPEVDVLLSQFAGGATGYPVCWGELYGDERIARTVKKNRAQTRTYVLDLVAAAKPRAWMPIAGYFLEAHPSDAEIGEKNLKNDPDAIAEAVSSRFPFVRTHRAVPGATIDLAATEERDPLFATRAPRPAHDFAPYVAAIAKDAEAPALATLEGVERYFAWAGFRGDLVLHVIETTENFQGVVREMFVDFTTGKVTAARPATISRYERMRVRSDVFRHVLLRGASWEEISIGFQARFYREPDVYNMDFWMHFQHELPAEPPF